MPIFEFKCKGCGKISEFLIIHTGSRDSIKCRFCGNDWLEKVLSAPGMVKSESGSHTASTKDSECCGATSPCANPKRCCTEGNHK